MGKSKKAFTLIELIVTVTIVAILGTIGFISLVRNNADARDSIRISDSKALARNIGIKVNAEKIGNIDAYFETFLPQNTFASGSVYNGESLSTISYRVGTPSVVQFGVNNYLDPSTGNPYPISMIQGEFGNFYQVGARLENNIALVHGNYFTLTGSDLSGIIKAYDTNNPIIDGGIYMPY